MLIKGTEYTEEFRKPLFDILSARERTNEMGKAITNNPSLTYPTRGERMIVLLEAQKKHTLQQVIDLEKKLRKLYPQDSDFAILKLLLAELQKEAEDG